MSNFIPAGGADRYSIPLHGTLPRNAAWPVFQHKKL
jgi:hypothetical protein